MLEQQRTSRFERMLAAIAARFSVLALMKWISFIAGTFLTATSEHDLFVLIGANTITAWAFPVMLDCYCAAAFATRSKGNVAAALVLMIVSQILAHVFGPHTAGAVPTAVIIVLSIVPPAVLWQIHNLKKPAAAVAETATAQDAEIQRLSAALAALQSERDNALADAATARTELADALNAPEAKVRRSADETRQIVGRLRAHDWKVDEIADLLKVSTAYLRKVTKAPQTVGAAA